MSRDSKAKARIRVAPPDLASASPTDVLGHPVTFRAHPRNDRQQLPRAGPSS